MIIDKKTLLNATPRSKTYELNICTHISLSVHPCGSRTLLMRYRKNNKIKCLTIGNIDLYTNEELNNQVREAKRDLKLGVCPATKKRLMIKQNKESSITIKELITYYSEKHVSTLKSADQINALLRKYLVSRIGHVRLSEFNQQILEKTLRNAGETVQRKIAKLLYAAFNFAIARELIATTNPMNQKVNNFGRSSNKTQRYLKEEHIKLLLNTMSDTSLNVSFQNAVKLLIATGQRRNEILGMKWNEIDFNKSELTIPPERLKTATGRDIEKQLAHTVFLSDYALNVLNEQKKHTKNSSFVFANVNIDVFNRELTRAIKQINDLMHFTPHDLRRTFFTNNLKQGHNVKVLEKILNHAIKGVEAHYNFAEFEQEQRDVMNQWGQVLTALNQ
jgi:integrase